MWGVPVETKNPWAHRMGTSREQLERLFTEKELRVALITRKA